MISQVAMHGGRTVDEKRFNVLSGAGRDITALLSLQ